MPVSAGPENEIRPLLQKKPLLLAPHGKRLFERAKEKGYPRRYPVRIQPMSLPTAALPASGIRVEAKASSQPLIAAPLFFFVAVTTLPLVLDCVKEKYSSYTFPPDFCHPSHFFVLIFVICDIFSDEFLSLDKRFKRSSKERLKKDARAGIP